MGGIRHQERNDPAAVQTIDEFERVDPHLPAELCMPGPDAADPHHSLQRDLQRQLAQCPHPRAICLLEGEDGESPLVAEVNGHQCAAHVRWGTATNPGSGIVFTVAVDLLVGSEKVVTRLPPCLPLVRQVEVEISQLEGVRNEPPHGDDNEVAGGHAVPVSEPAEPEVIERATGGCFRRSTS